VFAVTPYRYVPQSESAKVTNAIRELAAGRIDMVAFTSSPQVERLVEVAGEAGLGADLIAALARVPVAAVGPIVEEKLHELGVVHIVRPESAFHLKPLVRAIAAAKSADRRDGPPAA
jgi:uroporphyrinogen-III synthase